MTQRSRSSLRAQTSKYLVLILLTVSITIQGHAQNGSVPRLISKCVVERTGDVQESCSATHGEGQTTTPRLAVASLLHACIDDSGDPRANGRPLRFLAPDGPLLQSLSKVGSRLFSQATGIEVDFALVPFYTYATQRQSYLLDPLPPNATDGYDLLMATATGFGDVAQVPGKLPDLSYLIAGDPAMNWNEIPPQFRAVGPTYNGSVRAVPLLYSIFLTYYRRDIFLRDNLTVPQTWEEFTDLAERYHGRDGLIGACIMPIGCMAESLLLRSIFGSYVQTLGASHGVFWDPETLQPLVNTPAMEAALNIFRRLQAVGPQKPDTPTCYNYDFVKGNCLLGLGDGSLFKFGSIGSVKEYTAVRGKMGFALMPGSTRVLDRKTRQLVTCTQQICPNAQGKTAEGLLVNRPLSLRSTILLVNGLSPLQYQFFAYQLASYMASPSVIGTKGMLTLENELLPIREDDISMKNVPVWTDRGYDTGDVERFFSTYREMTITPNLNADVRIRLTSNVTEALLTASLRYNNPALNLSAAAVMDALEATLNGIMAVEGREVFAMQYRRSINWVPPAALTTSATATGADDTTPRTLPIVVGAVCGALLVVSIAVAAVLVHRRRAARRKMTTGVVEAPGVGPNTTLCITDIQDSTTLWEELSEVMNVALDVHHGIIRRLLVTHNGYECLTEGDSFIVAFHTVSNAVQFCLELQQALLEAAWPKELLLHESSVRGPLGESPTAEVVVYERPQLIAAMQQQNSKGRGKRALQQSQQFLKHQSQQQLAQPQYQAPSPNSLRLIPLQQRQLHPQSPLPQPLLHLQPVTSGEPLSYPSGEVTSHLPAGHWAITNNPFAAEAEQARNSLAGDGDGIEGASGPGGSCSALGGRHNAGGFGGALVPGSEPPARTVQGSSPAQFQRRSADMVGGTAAECPQPLQHRQDSEEGNMRGALFILGCETETSAVASVPGMSLAPLTTTNSLGAGRTSHASLVWRQSTVVSRQRTAMSLMVGPSSSPPVPAADALQIAQIPPALLPTPQLVSGPISATEPLRQSQQQPQQGPLHHHHGASYVTNPVFESDPPQPVNAGGMLAAANKSSSDRQLPDASAELSRPPSRPSNRRLPLASAALVNASATGGGGANGSRPASTPSPASNQRVVAAIAGGSTAAAAAANTAGALWGPPSSSRISNLASSVSMISRFFGGRRDASPHIQSHSNSQLQLQLQQQQQLSQQQSGLELPLANDSDLYGSELMTVRESRVPSGGGALAVGGGPEADLEKGLVGGLARRARARLRARLPLSTALGHEGDAGLGLSRLQTGEGRSLSVPAMQRPPNLLATAPGAAPGALGAPPSRFERPSYSGNTQAAQNPTYTHTPSRLSGAQRRTPVSKTVSLLSLADTIRGVSDIARIRSGIGSKRVSGSSLTALDASGVVGSSVVLVNVTGNGTGNGMVTGPVSGGGSQAAASGTGAAVAAPAAQLLSTTMDAVLRLQWRASVHCAIGAHTVDEMTSATTLCTATESLTTAGQDTGPSPPAPPPEGAAKLGGGGGGGGGGSNEAGTVVFRGLRVRAGLTCGVPSESDIIRDARNGRVQYSGKCMRLAKLVSDSAHGGMVLMSDAARWTLEAEAGDGGAQALNRRWQPVVVWMGRHSLAYDMEDVHLFQLTSQALVARLALLQRPLRSLGMQRPLTGALAAPVGAGAAARLHVPGGAVLMAWNAAVTARALDIMYSAFLDELRKVKGQPYVVEGATGLYTDTPLLLRGGAPGPVEVTGPTEMVGAAGQARSCTAGGIGGAAAAIASRGSSRALLYGALRAGVNGSITNRTASDTAELSSLPSTTSVPVSQTRQQRSLVGKGSKEAGGRAGRSCVMTAVFDSPDAGALWLLRVQQVLPHLPWPAELLEHPLCEPINLDLVAAVVVGQETTGPIPDLPSFTSPSRRPPRKRDSLLQVFAAAGRPSLNPAARRPPSTLSASRVRSSADAAAPLEAGIGAGGGSYREAGVEAPRIDERELESPQPASRTSFAEGLPPEESMPIAKVGGILLGNRRDPDFAGMRACGVLSYGDLGGQLPPVGSLSGQVVYKGKAWQALNKMTTKAKVGQVCTNNSTLVQLRPEVAAMVVLDKNIGDSGRVLVGM